jgi:dipeptidyl aminopeptidase/acylaminoacyl peptidase
MKRFIRLLAAALLSALASVNVLAFMQARAMTHFAEAGERTGGPEQLGALDRLTVIISGVNIPRPRIGATPRDMALPFETHRFPSADGTTLEAWYVPRNEDQPVIALFHGYAASKSTLMAGAKAFHDLGYATLLVDFYGSGGSSGSGTTIGVKEAEDVTATVDYARRTWPNRRLVLYGISMGGAAVLRAIAANGVKPDAIIIEATFDRLLNAGRNRFRAMGFPGSPFAELLLFWGSLQHGFNYFSHNPIVYARAVDCPTLVLHGEKDQRATLEQARGIARAIGAKARFVGYADVPHMAIVAARVDDWKRDVQTFLQQLQR